MQQNVVTPEETQNLVVTPADLLAHWQGHRRVTRRLIEAFPEHELFHYSVGGMRPFAELIMEMIAMTGPGIRGVATRQWPTFSDGNMPKTKKGLLQLWDDTTLELDSFWSQIPDSRFRETDKAFGQWEGTIHSTLFYFIDNEIHHRGQGYVYLRSLGIQPPAFYDRS